MAPSIVLQPSKCHVTHTNNHRLSATILKIFLQDMTPLFLSSLYVRQCCASPRNSSTLPTPRIDIAPLLLPCSRTHLLRFSTHVNLSCSAFWCALFQCYCSHFFKFVFECKLLYLVFLKICPRQRRPGCSRPWVACVACRSRAYPVERIDWLCTGTCGHA
jgi:hypothetical protein